MTPIQQLSARARPMMIGSGITGYTWPGTGQMVVSTRPVNTQKNERWSYQRRLP